MTMTLLQWPATDRETLKQVLPGALVVLPIGATEQHGKHLATGTDALMAATTAQQAAQQAAELSPRPIVLGPTMPFGASDHHLPFGATMSLSAETLHSVLLDLLRSVSVSGGRRVVLVNGHGGNIGTCHSAAAAASTRHDLAVAYVDYWRFAGSPGHAGEFETSLVAAVQPDWVGKAEPREGVVDMPVVADVDIYSSGLWKTIDGYTDRPELASAQQGTQRLSAIVDALADRLIELAKTL